MRRMMKLVIERSVTKLLATVKKSEIVDAAISRLDINDDVIAERVIDFIDTKAVARAINIRGEIRKEFEDMDFTDQLEDAAGVHFENVDWGDWVEMEELSNELDYAELARHIGPDEFFEDMDKTQGSFYDALTKIVRGVVSTQVQSPIDDAANIPLVGHITMVDRVIDAAATKLLALCERTLELGDEADENHNTITEGTINGASSTVSVPAT